MPLGCLLSVRRGKFVVRLGQIRLFFWGGGADLFATVREVHVVTTEMSLTIAPTGRHVHIYAYILYVYIVCIYSRLHLPDTGRRGLMTEPSRSSCVQQLQCQFCPW